MAQRYGRRNQTRPAPKRAAASPVPSQARPNPVPREDLEFLERAMANQSFAIVCHDAGVAAMGEGERSALLASVDRRLALRAIAEIQSRLDVATSTDWTQSRVELDLLASTEFPCRDELQQKVRSGHRLIPPRSTTQLIRETLESASDVPGAEPITTHDVVWLILSITTSHLSDEMSPDGTLDAEGVARIAAMAAGKSFEEQLELLREIMVEEIANLHGNSPAKLETLMASTNNVWLRPWPGSVTDPRLGDSPADSFASANGIELLDVLTLGHLVGEGARAGILEFSRSSLTRAGATDQAVSFLLDHMSLTVAKFKQRLAKDRRKGKVDDQRYTFTERPFLRVDADTVVLLRYQWGIDRFFGSQLYWQTFFMLGALEPGSVAESFSLAMNDVFEEAAAEALAGIVSASRSMTRLIRETEMQDAWAESPSRKPSVCDFVIPAGSFCIALDATNHHLNAQLAQGMASVGDYAEDVEKSLIRKCNQIAATIRQLRRRCDYGVNSSTNFLPLVVVPTHGVPNLTTVEYDLQLRSRSIFSVTLAKVLAPTVITLSDLELLEGIAEQYQHGGPDICDVLIRWRREATIGGPMGPTRLQEFLERVGIQRPIPKRILESWRSLQERLKASLGDAADGLPVRVG